MEYIPYEIKKGLWKGTAPVPSKTLNIAQHLGKGVEILWKGKSMKIDDLKSYVDSHEFPDKFGAGTYKLYYYKWQENDPNTSIS